MTKGNDLLRHALMVTDLEKCVSDEIITRIECFWNSTIDKLHKHRDKAERLVCHATILSEDLFYSLEALVKCSQYIRDDIITPKSDSSFDVITASYALINYFHLCLFQEKFEVLKPYFYPRNNSENSNPALEKLLVQKGVFVNSALMYIQDNKNELATKLLEKAQTALYEIINSAGGSSGQRKAHILTYLARAKMRAFTGLPKQLSLDLAAKDIEWVAGNLDEKHRKANDGLIAFDYATAACTLAKLGIAGQQYLWYQKAGALRACARKHNAQIMSHPLFVNHFPAWQTQPPASSGLTC